MGPARPGEGTAPGHRRRPPRRHADHADGSDPRRRRTSTGGAAAPRGRRRYARPPDDAELSPPSWAVPPSPSSPRRGTSRSASSSPRRWRAARRSPAFDRGAMAELIDDRPVACRRTGDVGRLGGGDARGGDARPRRLPAAGRGPVLVDAMVGGYERGSTSCSPRRSGVAASSTTRPTTRTSADRLPARRTPRRVWDVAALRRSGVAARAPPLRLRAPRRPPSSRRGSTSCAGAGIRGRPHGPRPRQPAPRGPGRPSPTVSTLVAAVDACDLTLTRRRPRRRRRSGRAPMVIPHPHVVPFAAMAATPCDRLARGRVRPRRHRPAEPRRRLIEHASPPAAPTCASTSTSARAGDDRRRRRRSGWPRARRPRSTCGLVSTDAELCGRTGSAPPAAAALPVGHALGPPGSGPRPRHPGPGTVDRRLPRPGRPRRRRPERGRSQDAIAAATGRPSTPAVAPAWRSPTPTGACTTPAAAGSMTGVSSGTSTTTVAATSRARAVLPKLEPPWSSPPAPASRPRRRDLDVPVVALPSDVPPARRHDGTLAPRPRRARAAAPDAALARRRREHGCTTAVVDVSMEVTVLARLLGLRVVTVRQSGHRRDPAHRIGLGDRRRRVGAPAPRRSSPSTTTPTTALVLHGRVQPLRRAAAAPGRRRPADGVVLVVGTRRDGLRRAAWRAPALRPGGRSSSSVPASGGAPGRWTAWATSRRSAAAAAADVVVASAGVGRGGRRRRGRGPPRVVPEPRPFDEQTAAGATLAAAGLAVDLGAWPAGAAGRGARRRHAARHRSVGPFYDGRGACRAAALIDESTPHDRRCGDHRRRAPRAPRSCCSWGSPASADPPTGSSSPTWPRPTPTIASSPVAGSVSRVHAPRRTARCRWRRPQRGRRPPRLRRARLPRRRLHPGARPRRRPRGRVGDARRGAVVRPVRYLRAGWQAAGPETRSRRAQRPHPARPAPRATSSTRTATSCSGR